MILYFRINKPDLLVSTLIKIGDRVLSPKQVVELNIKYGNIPNKYERVI